MSDRLLFKRLGCMLLAGVLMLEMAGCGDSGETDSEESKEIVLTGEMVPVANCQEIRFDLNSLNNYEWQGDHLIYLDSVWDKERDMSTGTLYQVNLDGTGAPEAVYTGISEDCSILEFVLGEDGFFYVLERKREEDGTGTLYLRKTDSDFQEIYLRVIEDKDLQQATDSFGFFSDMYTDGKGNILLTDYDGQGYFFDADGSYIGNDIIGVTQGGMINAGEQGMFFVQQDWSGSGMNYLFQKVDFATGRFGNEENRDLSAARQSHTENGTVLSGHDLGILISMENGLWSYDYDTGECTKLLDWQSMGVNGSNILEIRLLEQGFPVEKLGGYTEPLTGSTEGVAQLGIIPEISPVLEAFSYNPFRSGGDEPEIVSIGYLDRGYVPERQTITIGMAYVSTIRLGQLVRSFNRSNMEYEVVIKSYEDIDAFTNDLLFNPSEMADMLELGWIDKDMLEEKGLLEDLRPYIKESDVVGEDDLMEVVLEACESDGKLTSMMVSFSVNSLGTTAETVPRDGWTYDQLFQLVGDYPDSKLLNVYSPRAVWALLSHTMGTYIDWEKRECHYDSPEFIHLLENIRSLSYPENQEVQRVFYSDEETRKFLNREYLLTYNHYYSPYDYSRMYTQYKDKAWDVGFPTRDGELCFLLNPMMQFSIYSNSPNKDGAWAFLEFVLSEEEQNWYGSEFGGFPVRKDAFEAYLTRPYDAVHKMADDYTSEETVEKLREVMAHLYVQQYTESGEISRIIDEETQAFFAGDKTVEQCVEIIQNRVQLYLDENF